MTDTELKLMSAAAIIGLSKTPNKGLENARRDWDTEYIVDERGHQIQPDILQRGLAKRHRAAVSGLIAPPGSTVRVAEDAQGRGSP